MNTKSALFDALHDITETLNDTYHDTELSTAHAWWLLETATRSSRAHLITHLQRTLTDYEKTWITDALEKIIQHAMPIQYVIGSVPFLDLTITVETPILIPRPETEAWVADLIAHLRNKSHAPHAILDLCTGSGCIALALARAFPTSMVDAVDCDPRACTLTERNMISNNITTIRCWHGDLFDPLPPTTTYDLIVANPPYIPRHAYETLDDSVRLWEAQHALSGGADGLEVIRRIISTAPSRLTHQGLLCIEIDATQGKMVYDLFEQAGYSNIILIHDDSKRARMVSGKYIKKD